jgi:hypothetical protein
MRAAIKTAIENATTMTVYQPFMASNTTTKPFAVVKYADEVADLNNRRAKNMAVQVWVYAKKDSYLNLDTLVGQVITALDEVALTNSDSPPGTFSMRWTNTTPDFFDDDLEAICKRVDFVIPSGR